MKFRDIIKFIYDEFVYGGHLLSLGAVGVVLTSSMVFNIKVTVDILIIVYIGAQAVYYYNHFKEFKEDFITNRERTLHVKNYLKYIPLLAVVLIFAVVIVMVCYNRIAALWFTLLTILGGLLYSKLFKKYTINIIAFKNIFASLMGIFLVAFPFIYYSYPLTLSVYLLMLFIGIKWFITTSFLDIKDIESDKQTGFKTLPIILNNTKLYYYLVSLSLLSLIPIGLGVYLALLPKFSLIFFLSIIYSFYYLQKIKLGKANNYFLNYIFVDSEYILLPVFIYLSKILI